MIRAICIALLCVLSSQTFAQQKDTARSVEDVLRQGQQEIARLWPLKQYEQALTVLRDLYNTPDMSKNEFDWPGILYNMACAHSLLGNPDSALIYLDKSVSAGYYDYEHVGVDSDLDLIRNDPRYQTLVARMKREKEFWDGPALATPYRENISDEEKLAGLAKLWMEFKLNFVHFDKVPNLNFDSLYLAYLPKVSETKSTLEYYRVLCSFCAILKDGHTGVNPPPELYDQVWDIPGVRTQLVEDKVIITRLLSDTLKKRGVRVGMEVVEIDSVPVKEYAERFVIPYLSVSTPQGLISQAYTMYLLDGPRDKPVLLTLRDEKNHLLRVEARRDEESPPLASVEFKMLKGDVAYVNIRTFGSDSVAAAFDSLFPQIMTAKGLVIDVRKNGGGNSSVGYKILGYLTDRSFGTLRSEQRVYSSQRRYLAGGIQWDTSTYKSPPNGARLFTGPVAILEGPMTGSAAEDFLVAFDYMKRGVMVGEPSAGSTGQPLSFRLPGNLNARVCIRHCQYPDGKEYVGVGVHPGILVKPTIEDIRDGRDPVLDSAVAYVRRK
ncbi:MAG TPA: S41 family peptidase [Candidatus Acidoferrum sp.]|nr:S41 family peptidase [Candidatus Acidoferrum sp.]